MNCKDCFYNDGTHCSFVDNKEFTAEERKCFKDKTFIVEFPCRIGDIVYRVNRYNECIELCFFNGISESRTSFMDTLNIFSSDFGKTMFRTKEEAVKALNEREKE